MMMTPKTSLLLFGSCVAGIASVGSIFELASGEPQLGNLITGTILALSIPLVFLMFYAAVRDANSNT